MRLYIHMILNGSICTLLYIIFNNIFSYELPLKYRRDFLRINILFYLLPVPWIIADLKSGILWVFEKLGILYPREKITYSTDVTSVWNSVFIVNENGKFLDLYSAGTSVSIMFNASYAPYSETLSFSASEVK